MSLLPGLVAVFRCDPAGDRSLRFPVRALIIELAVSPTSRIYDQGNNTPFSTNVMPMGTIRRMLRETLWIRYRHSSESVRRVNVVRDFTIS